ncbi:hypothetical protein KC929_01785, partial [Patescibacteria group bacterium]|nr:hypothetical protein [Patescibacteria group bacterium]
AQIVRTILGTGNFDWSDTRLTAASLALFIVSVVAQSIVLLLVRAYYASGRTWKPLWITLTSSVLTVGLAYVFVYLYNLLPEVQNFFEVLLRISDVPGSSVVMLSLAYSVGMFVNLILLLAAFKRDFPYHGGFGIRRSFRQSFTGSLLMGLVAYLTLQSIEPYINQASTISVFMHGLVAGLVGIITGVLFLWLVRNEEIRIFTRAIRRRVWRGPIVHDSGM